MAVNDELGITHPGLGDNPNLAVILDLLIAQLKPLIVAQFASTSARGIAYPTITDAPKVNLVNEEMQVWSTALGGFFPLGGSRAWSASLGANAGIAAGAGGQVTKSFTGPAGTYLVFGTAAMANQTSTTQVALGEVRFDSATSGQLPFTMTGAGSAGIASFSRAWPFTTATSGSHSAQVVSTPTAADATLYHDTSVVALYLGALPM